MPSRRALLLPLAALLLSGCFTGKRPSFVEERFGPHTATGDPAIDALLTKMDAAASTPPTFTAEYEVVVRFGNVHKQVAVAADGVQRSVTVGDVRLVHTPGGAQTCRGGDCTPGIDATAISDTQLTEDFWAADAAKRLRVDAAAKIGPTTQRTEQVAGQTATCVDVSQTNNNTATYCVLDSGVLARIADADVYVTLTSYAPTAESRSFDPPA